MSSPREKVDALVRLATNAQTPVEEARTAAMLALRLIVEHKMLDRGATPFDESTFPKSARPTTKPFRYSWTSYDDPIKENFGSAEDLEKLMDFMKRVNESQRRKAQDEEKK
jgi:hypothetical protein